MAGTSFVHMLFHEKQILMVIVGDHGDHILNYHCTIIDLEVGNAFILKAHYLATTEAESPNQKLTLT